MINKIRLLFDTVRHLKFTQVFHQIYYRLRPTKTLAHYCPNDSEPKLLNRLVFDFSFRVPEYAKTDLTFDFLNLSKQFSNEIDWDFQGYGKLWNYNLQYFNYLHQADLDNEIKDSWLLEINDWLVTGKLKLEPYPVSLRIMNTIRYYSSRGEHNSLVVKSLYSQLNYLTKHLEYHLLGNHLLENAFALMMGGFMFNEKSWIDRAKKILNKELDEQILDDGGHFELSPMYHQIVLFRMLELIEWYGNSDQQDLVFMTFLKNKVNRMLGWLEKMTFGNGDIPHFNDSATGIALSSQELFQYAERLGLGRIDVDLNNSGYRRFIQGSYDCIIDVGAVGPSYQPGHSHADALSFVLYNKDKPLIVEAGTSTYQIGEKRNYERSTAAHNTVVVRNTNQSEVWGGFRVGKRAHVNILKEDTNQLLTEHNGYLHNFKVMHNRSFLFFEKEIRIKDEIGKENGTFYLHFHPECQVKVLTQNEIEIEGVGTIAFENANSLLLEKYEFADGYNQYLQATVLVVGFNNILNTSIYLNS